MVAIIYENRCILQPKCIVMNSENLKIASFIQDIQSMGKYCFSFDELSVQTGKTEAALKAGLSRLVQKKQIYNIRKGFYLIIPPEYSNMGIIPVDFYIDYLMRYLHKDYYVGLLSAAMLYGAAHQQPQVYQIITASPKLRSVVKEKVNISFSKRNVFPKSGIVQKKTETGYMKVSSPELTFLDLIHFEGQVGGYNKISTILYELSEEMKMNQLKRVLQNNFPIPVFQRAGFISEKILKSEKVTSVIEQRLKFETIRTVLLKSSGKKTGEMVNKWKIIVNTKIEGDL